MRIIIDRIEGKTAVLELPDGRTAHCDIALLPEGVKDGDILQMHIVIDEESRLKREQEVRSIQDKLKQ